nr:hypothetical protein [Tanacetum cinerariifolium]
SSAEETIAERRIEKANQQSKDLENQNKDLQEKYDVLINEVNTFEEQNNEFIKQIKVLNEKNADLLDQTKVLKDQLQVKHVVIDTHVECHEKYAKLEEERYEYMIRYSALFDNDKQHRKQIADQKVLFHKMSVELVDLDKHVRDLKNTVLEKDLKFFEFEECVCNKDLEIEKCLERLNVCENKLHKMGQTNQTVHMIMPCKDNLYNGRKGIGFENPSYFEKTKDLRPTLYDEKQTSSLKPHVPNVNLEKIIIDLEDEVVSLLEKEKVTLKTIESLKSKGFELSENTISKSKNQSENDCHVVEKECDQVENPKVIAPGKFKLSVSQSVSPISMSKMSCESNNVENLDTFSSVRRPKHSGVIWKKKGSSNTSNVDLSSVSLSKLNKNVKRYSRKDLLSCNSSHLRETSSASVCNDAINVSCNSRMCDVFDDINFFSFDDESVRISLVSKMPFRKKPRDSMNVRSKSNWNKSLSRTVHKWLPKMKPLAKPIAKWIPKVKRQIGLPKMKFEKDLLCFACEQGKIHRKHQKSKMAFASIKPLYLLHMDLCGPMRVKSINGKRYVLVVVDACSWYTWRIRTDNGMEFKNKTLAKFFDEVGITQQFSAARTPQQNDVVERRNRTLV